MFLGVSRSSSTSLAHLHTGPLGFGPALWERRSLLWQFTVRNVELRHKGSYLGLFWSLLNPLLMLVVYVFVFGYIFRSRFHVLPNESPVDYALGVFLGLIIYHFLAEVLATSHTVIVGNPNFVKKVVFPLEVLPASNVGAALIHMLISLCLLLIGITVVGPGLSPRVLWLPAIVAPLIPLSLGIAWLFSAIGVFFRDIGQVVGLLSIGLMFASAVVYPASMIPPAAWEFLRFNPLLLSIELARAAAMWDHPLNLVHLSYVWGVSLLVCAAGYWVFRKTAPTFSDVL